MEIYGLWAMSHTHMAQPSTDKSTGRMSREAYHNNDKAYLAHVKLTTEIILNLFHAQ